MVKFSIDDREVSGEDGWTILEVAREHGSDIPAFCHHGAMGPSGACQLCRGEVHDVTPSSFTSTDYGDFRIRRDPVVCLGRMIYHQFSGYNAEIIDNMMNRAENRCNSTDLFLNGGLSIFPGWSIPKPRNNYPW